MAEKAASPVGVMACIDLLAQQLVSAAHAAGILVPEEAAILGTNNDTVRCLVGREIPQTLSGKWACNFAATSLARCGQPMVLCLAG